MNDGRADGCTDRIGQTLKNFGWYNTIPSPLFVAGHKKGQRSSYDHHLNKLGRPSVLDAISFRRPACSGTKKPLRKKIVSFKNLVLNFY